MSEFDKFIDDQKIRSVLYSELVKHGDVDRKESISIHQTEGSNVSGSVEWSSGEIENFHANIESDVHITFVD